MATDLIFTGERFVPACAGEIAYEHWHRYAFARRFVEGRRVLDAACGEGYGTALLGTTAAEAVGVDIDAGSIRHAQSSYGSGRIRFVEGSCTRLPFPDASFDVVASFETIEHLDAADQPPMLSEFARVLKPDGLLIISSPNKRVYSDARGYVNEHWPTWFHPAGVDLDGPPFGPFDHSLPLTEAGGGGLDLVGDGVPQSRLWREPRRLDEVNECIAAVEHGDVPARIVFQL